MGIHNLNKFLKKEVPGVFRSVPISTFENTRIVIDSNLLFFKYFSKSYSEVIRKYLKDDDVINYSSSDFFTKNNKEMYNKVITEVIVCINNFCNLFVNRYHILPVFVLDGKCIEEKKDFAHIRRKKVSDSSKERIESHKEKLRADLDETRGMSEANAKTRAIEGDSESQDDESSVTSDNIDIKSEKEEPKTKTPKHISVGNLKRKIQNHAPINKIFDDFLIMKKYIRNVLKLPFLVAPNEGEKFCSYLVKTGMCSAVYTTDTDCIAFGAPLIITNIDFYRNIFEVSQTSVIYSKLNISHSQFIDFCIMLGCDFNTKLKGYGFNKLWAIIEKNNLLENTSKTLIEHLKETLTDISWDDVKEERCREIFSNFEDCEKGLEKNKNKLTKRFKLKENDGKLDENIRNIMLKKQLQFNWSFDDYKNIEFYE